MSARYAIYFAPDRHSPWWAFGAHWLGRDEHDNCALDHPSLDGMSPMDLSSITAEPRRYGFHATLKAPFRLSSGNDEAALVARLGKLAQTLSPVPLGNLRAATLGDFVALVPDTEPDGLQALAASCVSGLDDLRAPLTQSDLARRQPASLDPRETELLTRYGYPYVMERFRLHLTLTGPINASLGQRVLEAVTPTITRLNQQSPLTLDRLCLFVETSPGTPFVRTLDVRLRS